MKCEYVAELLPLYVGHDLEEERSSLVAAHLQSCLLCVRAADQYTRTSQLLQRLEPPFISDEVYAGIRREVLNQIEQQSHASVWLSFVRPLFQPLVQPRMTWVTAAIILGISLSVFYFTGKRSTEPSNEKPLAGGTRTGNGSNSSSSTSGGSLVSTGNASTDKKANAGHRRVQRKRGIIDIAQRRLTAGTAAAKQQVSASERPLQSAGDLSRPPSAAAPLRMEIQTSDRNIRIIWLGVTETTKGI